MLMQHVLRNGRALLFGAAVLGSLGFGASQAAASPCSTLTCDGYAQVYLGTCPGPGSDCSRFCESGLGTCMRGCCTCAY
jgi:hypothetical protein